MNNGTGSISGTRANGSELMPLIAHTNVSPVVVVHSTSEVASQTIAALNSGKAQSEHERNLESYRATTLTASQAFVETAQQRNLEWIVSEYRTYLPPVLYICLGMLLGSLYRNYHCE